MMLRPNAPRRWRSRRHGSGGKGASRHGARLAMLLGAATLSLGTVAGTAAAASASSMSSGTGWVRCAHLSPNTAPVDIYLYSFGDPKAMDVLRHVPYGEVGMYMKIPAGEYTAAIRRAGAPASTVPALSANLMVQAGSATLASNLAFASVTPYGTDKPGQWILHAAGGSETWSGKVKLTAGSIHTLVVLDSPTGLKVTDLMDAAGSAMMPRGGVDTGLGGTAPGPAPSPLPWLAGLATGLLMAAAAAARLYRSRAVARHAR